MSPRTSISRRRSIAGLAVAGVAVAAFAIAIPAASATVSVGFSASATPLALVGGPIKDVATISGGVSPTGTVTFTLFNAADGCAGFPLASSSIPVTGNGTYTSAQSFASAPSDYDWIAAYSGDDNNSPATTTCGVAGQTSTVVLAQVTTTTLPNGLVQKTYSAKLAAIAPKTPFKWSLPAGTLPPGLKMSTAGAITGTPTTPGTSTFTVQVTDSAKPANSAMATLSITIAPMTITTTSLPSTIVGKSYSAGLAVSGGRAAYKWALASGSTLPPGITLSSSGRLVGPAKVPGGYDFTVTVTDSAKPANTAMATLSITVAPMTITTTTLPSTIVAKTYSAGLAVSGGKAAYKWALAPGSTLPPGITLSSSGRFAGAAKVPGGYDFTVTVTDASKPANVAIGAFTITVAPMTITTTSLPVATVGKTYSAGLAVSGGKAAYKWALAPGSALPPGITLSTGGRFAGAAKVPGGYDFTVTVTDASKPANVAMKTFNIVVS